MLYVVCKAKIGKRSLVLYKVIYKHQNDSYLLVKDIPIYVSLKAKWMVTSYQIKGINKLFETFQKKKIV